MTSARSTLGGFALMTFTVLDPAQQKSAGEPARISQATAIRVPELQAEVGKTYTRNGPLGTVTRSLYIPYPKPKVSSVLTAGYIGHQDLRRYGVLTYQVFDDVYQASVYRYTVRPRGE